MSDPQNRLALAHCVHWTLAKTSKANDLLRLLLLKGVLLKLVIGAGELGGGVAGGGVEELEARTGQMQLREEGSLTYF